MLIFRFTFIFLVIFPFQFHLQSSKKTPKKYIINTAHHINRKFLLKPVFVVITLSQTSLDLNKTEEMCKIIEKLQIFHLSPIRYDISEKRF